MSLQVEQAKQMQQMACHEPAGIVSRLAGRSRKSVYNILPGRARRFSLPRVLGIGAQKAGTTWLYENLRAHPDAFVCEPKELHFFDWNFHKSLAWYADFFAEAGRRVSVDISPGYSIISKRRIGFIRRIMPELRIVFLMRNPIDRSWSQTIMNLVTATGRRFEEVSDQEISDHLKSARCIRRSNYLDILEKWLTYFDRDQIYIGFYDDIISEPQVLLADIFEHIGISTSIDWDRLPYDRVIHGGRVGEIPSPHRETLMEMYRDQIEELHRLFGGPVAKWRISDPSAGHASDLHTSDGIAARPGADTGEKYPGVAEAWRRNLSPPAGCRAY